MKLRGQTAWTKGAAALPLFLMFSLVLISPPGVLAQLPGDLVIGITSPSSGALVRGTVTVRANVLLPMAGVQFKLDGANLGAEDTTTPYEVPWNTTTASSGSHTLRAVARNLLGVTFTSDPVTVTVDNVPPTATINQRTGQADPTNASPIDFTVVFSEPVSGFIAADVTITGTAGGTKTVTVTGGPSTYNVAVSGVTNGTLIATIAAGMANDAAGNASTASTSTDNTVTVDATAPTVTINQAAAQLDPTNTSPINFTATFSEPVSGFIGADVTISGTAGGTKTVTVTGGPSTYNVAVSGMTNGTVVATIAAGVAHDSGGTGNTASTSTDNTVTFDASVPTAAITSPANGATVSSAVTVTASASDNAGVVAVQFKLDGANLGLEDTTFPFEVAWDTTTASDGPHTLTAEARDAAGNRTTSAPVTVTVAQGTTGTMRIEDSNTAVGYAGNWNQGNVSRPWSGGTAALGFALGDRAVLSFTGTGVRWIGFRAPWAGIAKVFVDQTLVATVDAYAAAETLQAVLFTASGLASGPHTLTIEVTRTKNPSSVDYTVFVDAFDVMGSPADATPPTVAVASPSSGTTVSGTIPVTASADDNVGVAGVTFFVDGAPLGAETTIAPHSINWNTTTVMDGAHTLTAVARDASGNTGSSLSVTVTVNNAAGPVKATRFENVSPSITYTNGSAAPMRPATWFHGSRSAPWSGGTASFNRSAGGRATFTFSGTLVRWIGFRASWAGIARVFLDGVFVGEVDLYSPTEQVQTAVFTATNLTAGSHTLAVEATGQKRGGDSCTPGDGDCASDYAVVVDAFDVAPGSPPPAAGTRFEETVPAMTYAGTWAPGDPSRAWSAGTAVSATAGAQATLTFTGTSVSWIGLRGPETGIARVFLDGAFQAEVDTFSPVGIQAVVFSVTGLAAARHTLTIDVTGGRNAAATNSLIVVDAFDVRSRFEDEDPSIAYTSTWIHADTDGAWSGTSLNNGAGTAVRSTTAGADATFTFTGTAVSWIGYRGPLAGIAEVFLDGAFVDRIDLYASADQPQVPVFTATGLAPASHTLRILVTGERNPAATAARVVVDAFDVTLLSPLPMVTRTQDTNPSVTYTAPTEWNQGARFTAWSGETAAFSATPGARATFAFTGTSVRWVGQRGFGFGIARIFLDGALVGEADTFAPFQEEFQAAIFSATGLPAGNHTLTIEVTGLKNPASGGTQIVVDAFDVY